MRNLILSASVLITLLGCQPSASKSEANPQDAVATDSSQTVESALESQEKNSSQPISFREELHRNGNLLETKTKDQYTLEVWEYDEEAFPEYYFFCKDENDSITDEFSCWVVTEGEDMCSGQSEENSYKFLLEESIGIRIDRKAWEGTYPCLCVDDYQPLSDEACLEKRLANDDPYKIIGEDKYTYSSQEYRVDPSGKFVKIEAHSEPRIENNCSFLENLDGLPKEHLQILKQCIYAHRGFIFEDKPLTERFSQYDWYTPQFEDVSEQLDARDKELIAYLESLGV